MCGFLGYYGYDLPDHERQKRALEALRHRGPDGAGIYVKEAEGMRESFTVLHRRLSIIDIESGSNQPMQVRGKILAFNGEIYNYMEVRSELEKCGEIFQTDGDTEVLARALGKWGIDGLERLEGMWSFAWYDTIQNSLILCRDRFGEKPLFVWKQKNGIYFGSELNSLFIYAGFKAQVNRRMLARYLYEGYRSMHRDVNTFFEGINQVESGSYLSMRSLNVQESTKYWEPNWNKSQELSRTESIDLVREAMINAVKLRLRADVPIAFCMSGGIDSNSLIGIAKNCLNYEPHGFTLIGSDKRYQEEGMVDIMAKNCGIKNTKIELSSEGSFGKLKDLVSLKCQPVATISYFIHWQMMQLISQMGYKVSISGTGADEIFSGYYDHHLLYLASISQGTDFHVNSVNNWKKYVKPQVRNELLRNPYKYCVDPEARNHIYADSMMFVTEEGKKLLNGFSEVKYTDDLMRNRMLNELFHESVPVMLQEDDFNSMYYSIENRSPFLDRKLVEGVYGSVPTIRLIEDGKAKFILREAMRGIVPEQIINNRKKIGFNADINDILDFGNDRELWEYLNEDSEIYNLVDKTSVQALAVQSTKSNADSKFLFSVLCTKLFLDFGA